MVSLKTLVDTLSVQKECTSEEVKARLHSYSLTRLVDCLLSANRQRMFNVQVDQNSLRSRMMFGLSLAEMEKLRAIGDEIVVLKREYDDLKYYQTQAAVLVRNRLDCEDIINSFEKEREEQYSIVSHLPDEWRSVHKDAPGSGSLGMGGLVRAINRLYEISANPINLDRTSLQKVELDFQVNMRRVKEIDHDCRGSEVCKMVLDTMSEIKTALASGVRRSHEAIITRQELASAESAKHRHIYDQYVNYS